MVHVTREVQDQVNLGDGHDQNTYLGTRKGSMLQKGLEAVDSVYRRLECKEAAVLRWKQWTVSTGGCDARRQQS